MAAGRRRRCQVRCVCAGGRLRFRITFFFSKEARGAAVSTLGAFFSWGSPPNPLPLSCRRHKLRSGSGLPCAALSLPLRGARQARGRSLKREISLLSRVVQLHHRTRVCITSAEFPEPADEFPDARRSIENLSLCFIAQLNANKISVMNVFAALFRQCRQYPGATSVSL